MRQCIVVRTYDPSPAAAARIARWAAAAAAAAAAGYAVDVCVQVDVSRQLRDARIPGERRARKRQRSSSSEGGGDGVDGRCGAAHAAPPAVSPTHRIMRALAEHGVRAGVHVHRYTEDDLLSAFPQLVRMRRHLIEHMNVREISSGKVSLAWGFHVEALLLWWRNATQRYKIRTANSKPKNKTNSKSHTSYPYDFVWVVEDDVGVAGGSLPDLLDIYARSHPDTDFLTHDVKPMDAGWYWADVHTGDDFLTAVDNVRLTNREHVQRFSPKLLAVLDTLACAGVSSWSEMHVPSVAKCARHGLSCEEFSRRNIGKVYSWDGRIHSEEEWRKIDEDAISRALDEQRVDVFASVTAAEPEEAFTKTEFLEFYGGLDEWEKSKRASPEVVAACQVKLYHALKW